MGESSIHGRTFLPRCCPTVVPVGSVCFNAAYTMVTSSKTLSSHSDWSTNLMLYVHLSLTLILYTLFITVNPRVMFYQLSENGAYPWSKHLNGEHDLFTTGFWVVTTKLRQTHD